MIDYSQHKESTFIFHYLEKYDISIPQICVEIGAKNGITNSNTRMFADMGWKCIMVEPCRTSYKQLEENCKQCDNIRTVNKAVDNQTGVSNFKEVKELGHSHLSDRGYEVITVTYQKLIEQNQLTRVGILSIDTEGMDTDIVLQVIASPYLPSVIIVESNTFEARRRQINILNDDYCLLNVMSVNTVWIRNDLAKKPR